MEIIQAAYEVPDDVYAGLATGALTRFGSVAWPGIIRHLKEIPIPKAENGTALKAASASATASKSVFSAGKRHCKKAPYSGGCDWGCCRSNYSHGRRYCLESLKLKRSRTRKIELPECVKAFNNAFSTYLEEARAGNLNESTLDILIEELNSNEGARLT